ncbi:MAG: GNAT family N-acetyltransferase [Deltaproteobacteria bacterium]|jgi:GNAT superfamily N-acetyltransferase|nr:GNAT family N-acetyltransferase [Deltaproteobacteria bacterium]
MSEGVQQASARVLAATLTLFSREMDIAPPPFSFWTGQLTASEIKQAAMEVVEGKAGVLWVDESYPALGLMLYSFQSLEEILLGYRTIKLKGPWLVEGDALEREKRVGILAEKAKVLALERGVGLITIKTGQDPAVLRALTSQGFQLAEISTRFKGSLNNISPPEYPFLKHPGLSLKKAKGPERQSWLEQLGDLFYDGHYLHGPYLEPDFQNKLWRQVTLRELNKLQPALFLWDERSDKPVGLALASLFSTQASLTVLYLSENKRGQGLGRLLVLELIRLLRSLGVNELFVETASWNLPALAVYRTLGLKFISPLVALHWEPSMNKN